jgi:hypothetical protein
MSILKKLPSEEEINIALYNPAQLLYSLVLPQFGVTPMARATGKSEGPSAIFSRENVRQMPRSMGIMVADTYANLALKIIPGIKVGWAKLGWFEGVHYFINQKPPRKWKWDDPYRPPSGNSQFIHFWNGAGAYLLGNDRSNNQGPSVDWGLCEEAKNIQKRNLDELFLTIRGHEEIFGHLSCHHSRLYVSDMPDKPSAMWMLDDFEPLVDEERIQAILCLQDDICQLQEAYHKEVSKRKQQIILNQITAILTDINMLRKGLTGVFLASTLENVDTLGINYILDQWNALRHEPEKFRRSILNIRPSFFESAFYPLLDEYEHGYESFNYNRVDELAEGADVPVEYDYFCFDDINPDKPLSIGLDYNNKFNSMVVGQMNEHQGVFRFVNDFWVKPPLYTEGLVQKFVDFYKPHKCKTVYYYYDHTAYQGRTAAGGEPFYEIVINALVNGGWHVIPIDMGQTAEYQARFNLWHNLLKPVGKRPTELPGVEFNRTACRQLITCMQKTGSINKPIRTGGSKLEKDKTNETKKGFAPEEATHLTDAADTLAWGVFEYDNNNDKVASPFSL